MIKNSKGFTLIELLATIVILALISTVTVVSVTGSYQKSKEKAEEAFVHQIENHGADYISLYGSGLEYNNYGKYKKCYKNYDGVDSCDDVDVVKTKEDEVGIRDISDSVANKEFVNPSTEEQCTNDNTKLTIYRDSDFVYCFTLEPVGDNSCISDKIDTCSGIYSNWVETSE